MSKHLSYTTPEEDTLVGLLRRRGLRQTEQQAYIFLVDGELEKASLTYGELDREARAIGALLQDVGARGERVLLLYPPGLAYVAAFFGCLYAGAVAVPSYPPRLNRPDPRLGAIVRDARPRVALTTGRIRSNLAQRFTHSTELEALHWLDTDELDGALAGAWREPALDGETLAFLQYTSGSTAAPKGVMLTHDNLLHNLGLIQSSFGHSPESRGVIWLPPYHDMGLIGGLLGSLYGGFPVVLLSPLAFLQRPLRWLQAISRYRATTSGGPNFAYDLCVQKITSAQRDTLDLSSWEVAFNGAEPVRHETLERFATTFAPCGFRREAFYPCYGLAEATLIVSGGEKTATPIVRRFEAAVLERKQVLKVPAGCDGARTLVGCGQVLGEQKIVVVDSESALRCPPGRVGEIWIAGPSVARGYWNHPDETVHTFQAHLADTDEGPFLRTGDLGVLQEGELFVTGRLKDLIIVRGRNYYPQDLELSVEGSHPALRTSGGAAFSVDVGDEERLVIVQELKRSQRKASVEQVCAAIRRAVSEDHELQVYAIVLVKPWSIPRTSSGKIQRYLCRAGFLENSLNVIGSSILDEVDTADEDGCQVSGNRDRFMRQALLAVDSRKARQSLLELYLQEQIVQVLGNTAAPLDPQQPLTDLEIASPMAVELQSRVASGLGVTVSVEEWLASLSVRQLATRVLDQWERNTRADGDT